MTELALPLARFGLLRDGIERGKPDLFDSLWEEPNTKVLPMLDGKVLTNPDGTPKFFSVEEVPSATMRVFLGRSRFETKAVPQSSAIVLAVVGDNSANQIAEPTWQGLRFFDSGLSDLDAEVLTTAIAINNWHLSHRHCPSCGTPTIIEQGGWVRRCFQEDRELFPRTDPAVIVSILDEQDRILLGSQKTWEENRWSILAGFVEPGESLEAAVIREMKEESGLEVSQPSYLFSQSWPFPYSLMLGFTARADSRSPLLPDGEEIAKLRWFTREELKAESSGMLLPGPLTISRAMIENWYGAKLVSAPDGRSNGRQ